MVGQGIWKAIINATNKRINGYCSTTEGKAFGKPPRLQTDHNAMGLNRLCSQIKRLCSGFETCFDGGAGMQSTHRTNDFGGLFKKGERWYNE